MKKLLNTLYVLSEGNFLSLDGENVVVMNGSECAARFPLHTLENIISFSYKGATPALMGACAENNIGLSFYSPFGKFLARVSSLAHGNVLLRKEQYRIAASEEESFCFARNMVIGKVFNCRWTLERTIRDHALRVDLEKVKSVSQQLYEGVHKAESCKTEDTLRGIEGDLAAAYFSVFNEMILNQKEDFTFQKRNRRPPTDRINALLSFSYTILASDCANALESAGLDCYIGVMHEIRPGRKSLALDMMEEMRAPLADRFALTLVNMKYIRKEHFDIQKDGAVLLNDNGRRIFFTEWQKHKKEELQHPFLKEKINWGLVPHVQALLLARTIRGDLDAYPPFMWK